MPKNPYRKMAGGDVEGQVKTDTQWSVGNSIEIARASVDPGYETVLSRPDTTEADLLQGYCSYGRSVGEASDEARTTASYDGKKRKITGRLPAPEMIDSCAELLED